MQATILEFLERDRHRKDPGKVVIVDGDRSYTLAELERRAKSCAWLLMQRADVARQPVAVLLPRCAHTIFANVGIAYSGGIYTNLDAGLPEARLRKLLDQIGPRILITSQEMLPYARSLSIPDERIVLIEEFSADVPYDEAELSARLARLIDTDPLCIISTSGSTGVPKCVVLNHRSTIDFVDWCLDRLGLDGSERIGSLSPFHFDIYTLELNLVLARAATMVIVPEGLAAFPPKLMEFLGSQAVSFIFWVPSIMVNIAKLGLLDGFDPTSLKTVFFAGEVFPTKHLNHWRRRVSHATFVNLYGPIETAVDSTFYVLGRELSDDEPVPIGEPCRNTGLLLLDAQDRPCRQGETGEICIRGSSLSMGYWNDPDRTAKAFVQNPLNPHYPELIYRTGDLAFYNDRGELIFVGRRDFQIKHLGYRIELLEIEHAVLAVPGVDNACVLYDAGRKAITLFYETGAGDVTPGQIRKALSAALPRYMVPTVFHRFDELPRNPNGKIDRDLLGRRLSGKEAV